MAVSDLPRQRLSSQRLTGTTLETPAAVVGWLCAAQSQDYLAAKWAVAIRAGGLVDADLDAAFNAGEILRTHVMRPTWHFVTPADIRWLLKLTSPRVQQIMAQYYRRLGLDGDTLARTDDLLAMTLRDGKQLTRTELAKVVEEAGLNGNDLFRFGFIVSHAELQGIVCSGALRGKQHTYALIDDRAPNARVLERDEALAELVLRYFTSHGPAQIKDFVWWSGLTGIDARAGIDSLGGRLASEVVDGKTYWFDPETVATYERPSPDVRLLTNYDEYLVGYTDRTAVYPAAGTDEARGSPVFRHTVVVDGMLTGTWVRTLKKKDVEIAFSLFEPLPDVVMREVEAGAGRYASFLGLNPVIV